MLVCGLNIADSEEERPAPAYLRRSLLDYAASDEFQPRVEVSPTKLAKLLELPAPAKQDQRPTDQAVDPRVQKD